jgi:hypothetical protein
MSVLFDTTLHPGTTAPPRHAKRLTVGLEKVRAVP